MSTVNQIKILERKRALLIKKFSEFHFIIPGVVVKIHRLCGKLNCWCANSENGHPATRITWSCNGKPTTRAIKKEDIEWVKEATKNYRSFRKLRYNVRKINADLKILLDQLENEIVAATKKLKDCSW